MQGDLLCVGLFKRAGACPVGARIVGWPGSPVGLCEVFGERFEERMSMQPLTRLGPPHVIGLQRGCIARRVQVLPQRFERCALERHHARIVDAMRVAHCDKRRLRGRFMQPGIEARGGVQ